MHVAVMQAVYTEMLYVHPVHSLYSITIVVASPNVKILTPKAVKVWGKYFVWQFLEIAMP